MITIRRAADRGHKSHGWLDTYHTFSFADYYDPDFMGFKHLRVINEDRVAPSQGFDTHPHRNMEILTYVIEGQLKHQDSMGNGSLIHRGEFQRMTAGTGITHSEANPSETDSLHLYQIWILPEQQGLTPSYEQKKFPEERLKSRLGLVASPDGRDGSLLIHQQLFLYCSQLGPGDVVTHQLSPSHGSWIQTISGSLLLNGKPLTAGDGAAVTEETDLNFSAEEPTEFLIFDML